MRTFSLNLWIFRFRLYIMRYKLTVGKNCFFPAHKSRFGSTPCDFPSSLHSLGVKISNWASLSVSDTRERWLQCPEHIPQFLDDRGRLYSFGLAFNMIWIKLLFIIHLNKYFSYEYYIILDTFSANWAISFIIPLNWIPLKVIASTAPAMIPDPWIVAPDVMYSTSLKPMKFYWVAAI